MKRFKKSLILLLMIFLPLTFLHCTNDKEQTPFFDGLFLEYQYINRNIKKIYMIEVLDNNKFKIVRKIPWSALKDDIDEFLVDAYGRVYRSSSKDYKGKFSDIWIPVHKMEIGDTFDEGYTVLKRDQWKKWDVLVIKNPLFEEEQYFDLNTGFWVGSKGRSPKGTYEAILVNTNADIPVAE